MFVRRLKKFHSKALFWVLPAIAVLLFIAYRVLSSSSLKEGGDQEQEVALVSEAEEAPLVDNNDRVSAGESSASEDPPRQKEAVSGQSSSQQKLIQQVNTWVTKKSTKALAEKEGGQREDVASAGEIAIATINGNRAAANQLLVKLKGEDVQAHRQLLAENGLRIIKTFRSNSSLYSIALAGNEVEEASEEERGMYLMTKIQELMKTGSFEYAEPDWAIYLNTVPTDASYVDGTLWGLKNTGQTEQTPNNDGVTGTAGMDINVEPAWEITRGSEDVIVAVLDTGIRYTHEDFTRKDLAGNTISNMWVNEAELNGDPDVDDDGNGYVDDIHGWDTYFNDDDPMDGRGHGTHCAGTIAAAADNDFDNDPEEDSGKIVGVAPNVKLMACKIFNDTAGSGSISAAISGIDYAVEMGADVLSNSWGGTIYSASLKEAIERANDAGVLFVAAAGNDSRDNDQVLYYPCSYEVDNVISVASVTRNGYLSSFSNYGLENVDIAAPGQNISSLWHSADDSYLALNGTSMACPHVAGVAALLKSEFPSITISEYKTRLFETVTPLPSLQNSAKQVKTNGMVNAHAALTLAPDGELEVSCNPASTPILSGQNMDFYVTVGDLYPVLGATVTGTVVSNSNIVTFLDDGSSPDETANDGKYSASVAIPMGDEIEIDVEVTAANKSPFDSIYTFDVFSASPNDDFANAEELLGNYGTRTGSNVIANSESGEPVHSIFNFTVNSIWYKYEPSEDGKITLDTRNSEIPTILAAYTGLTLGTLNQEAEDYTFYAAQYAEVSFDVTSGITYYFAADGVLSDTGDITLNYHFTPDGVEHSMTNDHRANARELAGYIGSQYERNFEASSEINEDLHDATTNADLSEVHSLWWKYSPTENGLFTADTNDSTIGTLLAVYTGSSYSTEALVAVDVSSAAYVGSQVSFQAVAGETYYFMVDGASSDKGFVTLNHHFIPEKHVLSVVENAGDRVFALLPEYWLDPAMVGGELLLPTGESFPIIGFHPVYGFEIEGWDSNLNAGDEVEIVSPSLVDHPASSDTDRDGFTNEDEVRAGTNPFHGGVYPTFNQIGLNTTETDLVIKWQPPVGVLCQIEVSNDLQTWTNDAAIVGDGSEQSTNLDLSSHNSVPSFADPATRLFLRLRYDGDQAGQSIYGRTWSINRVFIPAESDRMVGTVGLRPAVYLGEINGPSVDTVNSQYSAGLYGTVLPTAGVENKHGPCLLKVLSGPQEGSCYAITSSDSSTIWLDEGSWNADGAPSMPAGTKVAIIPEWTVDTQFVSVACSPKIEPSVMSVPGASRVYDSHEKKKTYPRTDRQKASHR